MGGSGGRGGRGSALAGWQVLKRARGTGGELLTCARGDTWVTAVSDTVVDQPSPLPSYSVYTVFSYSIFGCLSTLSTESCRTKRSSRPCCLGSSPQKIKSDLVAGSKHPHKRQQEPPHVPRPQPPWWYLCWCTHHRVMKEQLPGLMKFLIAQHVHKVFKEIAWDWGVHEKKRGSGRAVPINSLCPSGLCA